MTVVEEIQDEQLLVFDIVYLQKLKEEMVEKEKLISLNIAKIEKQIFLKRKQDYDAINSENIKQGDFVNAYK